MLISDTNHSALDRNFAPDVPLQQLGPYTSASALGGQPGPETAAGIMGPQPRTAEKQR